MEAQLENIVMIRCSIYSGAVSEMTVEQKEAVIIAYPELSELIN